MRVLMLVPAALGLVSLFAAIVAVPFKSSIAISSVAAASAVVVGGRAILGEMPFLVTEVALFLVRHTLVAACIG